MLCRVVSTNSFHMGQHYAKNKRKLENPVVLCCNLHFKTWHREFLFFEWCWQR